MSSSITIMQSLSGLANSHNYCPTIVLDNKMEVFEDYKCEYQSLSNNIQIIPPSVWFGIEQGKCMTSIRNDVQRSRITRQGMLSTNLKGNMLNKISYQSYEEDVGTIQQTQQCFCVAFAVVKDSCQQFLKQIGSQLRSCLIRKSNFIDRSHIKVGQLDELSKQIYNKFRIFLIFDTKSQPGRLLSIHSCFYPNVRFTIQRIKKKQAFKFGPNEVLQQIQVGEIINNFGYLSLDKKRRLLMIKKDDPQLANDNLVGVWVISSFSSKRTRKQFGKQDAIWLALLDFYTNCQVRKKLSIISNQKGILCYFSFRKEKSKLQSPEYYLFQPSVKTTPKWSFLTKSQFVSDLSKSCEIKIDFLDNTIIEERQYSQFSDQTTNIQNINKQNIAKQARMKNFQNIANNESNLSGSSQSQSKKQTNKSKQEDDQKNQMIKELRAELQKYKQRCIQLQAMNRILMQQKISNQLMYANPYQMMNHPPLNNPQIYQYNNLPAFNYPLSYSQVTPPTNQYNQVGLIEQQKNQLKNANTEAYNHGSPKNRKSLNTKIIEQKNNQEFQKQKKNTFVFPAPKEQQITFGSQYQQNNYVNQKTFIKKSHSQGTQIQKKQFTKEIDKKRLNQQTTMLRKDLRNISFQDSFAQYYSQGQDEGPRFKFNFQQKIEQNQISNNTKMNQYDNLKKKSSLKQQKYQHNNESIIRSPQFKNNSQIDNNYIKNQQKKLQINKLSKPSKLFLKQSPPKVENATNKMKNLQINQIQSSNKDSKKQEKINRVIQKCSNSSSNQSDQQQKNRSKKVEVKNKKNEKQTQKRQVRKQKIVDSDSGDSDQDPMLKNLRLSYLKK